MDSTLQSFVTTIQSLEPAFKEAAQIAVRMQRDIQPQQKHDTGMREVDIVTAADFAVQEAVLKALVATELTQCRLIAEEVAGPVDHFNPTSDLIISIDPIDGTYRYAHGKPMFSLIIGLQQHGQPLYTFEYYPVIGWTHRIVGTIHHEEGTRPSVHMLTEEKKIMTYPYGDPVKRMSDEERQWLKTRGYVLLDNKQAAEDSGAKALLFSEHLQGYCIEDPSVYDGLVGLHYALAHGWKVTDRRQSMEPQQSPSGWRYPGYYFITRE